MLWKILNLPFGILYIVYDLCFGFCAYLVLTLFKVSNHLCFGFCAYLVLTLFKVSNAKFYLQ